MTTELREKASVQWIGEEGGTRPWKYHAQEGRLSLYKQVLEDTLAVRVLSYHRRGQPEASTSLQQRLDNVNGYFQRKSNEVFNDDSALRLLATMYEDTVIDISVFNSCQEGLPLSKLTAANFCEVGANAIYITEAGQRFIESIRAYEQSS